MIFIHLLYIPLYRLCKVFATRSWDSPETTATGILAFMFGFTLMAFYEILYTNYSKQISGLIFLATVIGTGVWFGFTYLKNDRFLKLTKKYKAFLILGTLLDGLWIAWIIHYMTSRT